MQTAVRFLLPMALAMIGARAGAAQTADYAILYSFQGSPDGANPGAPVLIGEDGVLYGTTSIGGITSTGTTNFGTVFALTPAAQIPWKETVLYNFTGAADGGRPEAGLVFGSGGALYGTTEYGGNQDVGAVFELAPPSTPGAPWIETVLANLPYREGHPSAPVLIGPGGTLYTTSPGGNGNGIAIALTPPAASGGSWTGSVIYTFDESTGYDLSGLALAGGSLFGTTFFGANDFYRECGGSGCGSVYELTPPVVAGAIWTEATIHTFAGWPTDGGNSNSTLTVGPGGILYGTTAHGGTGACKDGTFSKGCGTVFQLTPPTAPGGTWTETILYNFTGPNGDGAYPDAGVVLSQNGTLYGTTQYGGTATSGSPCTGGAVTGCGTVFELMPPAVPGGAWTETVLHSFTGHHGDGAEPKAGLVLNSDGVLYGTTAHGGTAGEGTVFAIKP